MKDWEINRVNELYRQLDQLKLENTQLREQATDLKLVLERVDQLMSRVIRLEDRLSQPAPAPKKRVIKGK